MIERAGRRQVATVNEDEPGAAPGGRPSTAFAASTVEALSASSVDPLAAVRRGEGTLSRGARGPAVKALQQALQQAGFPLPRWGADGRFGAETQRALKHFQAAYRLPATGTLDARTLAQLAEAAATPRPPPAPEYDELFADGVLRTTLAVGFDEVDAHVPEVAQVRRGLAARGYTPLDVARLSADEQARLGVADEPDAEYVTRTFTHHGQPVTAVVKLVTPDTPGARERFAKGLAQDEFVLYGGHGRYGSGPDFDAIDSPDGNFVIGPAFEPGHVTVGPNDLARTPLSDGYQLFFFDGCNTFRYFDDLRTRPKNKSTVNLDVIGSTTELYWHVTAENLFAMLDGVTAGKDLAALQQDLDALNRSGPDDTRRYFVGDGFDDNR